MQGIAGTPPFSQPDTLIQNVYDPQSLNRYAFEGGNPWKNVDPSGHIIQSCMYSPACVNIVTTLTNVLAWYVSDPSRVARSIGSMYLRFKQSGVIDISTKIPSLEDYIIYDGTYVPIEARGPNWEDPNKIKIPEVDIGKLLNNKPTEEQECEEIVCPTSKTSQIKPPKRTEDDRQNQNLPQNNELKNGNPAGGGGGKGGLIKDNRICVPGSFYVCRRVGKEVFCENIGNNC